MRGLFPIGLTLLTALAPLDAALARPVDVLHVFTGSDGAAPQAAMILDDAGNLYGTTERGGTAGLGTVFKLAPDGTYTVLHRFTGVDGDQTPIARLLRDKHGNLTGTTYGGNSNGTVFRLSPNGRETVLHKFSSADVAGYDPAAGLIADAHHNLYGTTTQGGAYGGGTAFKLAPDGTMTVLHAFGGYGDGWGPVGGLTEDAAGNLYGTTALGGGHNGGNVFKIAPDGTETVLHDFVIDKEGSEPWGGVIRDSQGNLFGETLNGAGGPQSGSVYKLAPDGTFTTLYMFQGQWDGAQPIGDLVADRHGNLYGTTSSGGTPENGGTVFRLSPEGTLKTLYVFDMAPHVSSKGIQPYAGLTMDGDGNLYGTTSFGGHRIARAGQGTIFEIDAK